MKRRIMLGVVAVAVAAVWAVAPVAAQKRGGTLMVGNDEDAVGLDPHISFAFASSNFYEHA